MCASPRSRWTYTGFLPLRASDLLSPLLHMTAGDYLAVRRVLGGGLCDQARTYPASLFRGGSSKAAAGSLLSEDIRGGVLAHLPLFEVAEAENGEMWFAGRLRKSSAGGEGKVLLSVAIST